MSWLDRTIDTTTQTGRRIAAFTRRSPLTATLLYVSLLCVPLILFVDKPLALWLKTDLDPYTFGFFKTITDLGLGGHWYAIFLVLLLVSWATSGLSLTVEAHERWRLYTRSWVYGIAVMVSSGLTITVMKAIFGRYRPRVLFDGGVYGFEPFSGANSFPSGHSQVIFSVAMALWFIYPRYRIAYVIAALLIALSRVATTVHFLSDTLMGSTIAILFAIWLRRKFEADGRPPVSLQALAAGYRGKP